MTDGDEERTRPWIERLDARHVWARNTDAFALRNGIRDYPRCLLVAPDGVVVWAGHPQDLDDATVTKHLAGAVDVPLWQWPAEVADVRAALENRRWGAALVRAQALVRENEELAPWRDRAVALIETLLAGVERVFGNGDVLGAWEAAYWFQAELKGTSLESRIAEIAGAIQEDPKTEPMWKAQTHLREVMARTAADVPAARANIAALNEIAAAHPATILALDARNGARFWETMIAGNRLPESATPEAPDETDDDEEEGGD